MADHDGTYAVAVAVAMAESVAVTIAEVAIAVDEHPPIVVVEALPDPETAFENPSADDPDLLGEAELFMGRSSDGGAAGTHRVGAAW